MTFITSENLFFICVSLAFLLLVSLIWNFRLEVKIKNLVRGKDGKSLEDSFVHMAKDIEQHKKFRLELERYLKKLEKRVSTSVRGVETINFNAFPGAESGGKSFATAILNEQGNGIIISSLQSRNRLSIFTKNISNGESEFELSSEEEAALTKALKSCSL